MSTSNAADRQSAGRPRALVFNGDIGLGGDTKVAVAVARALAHTCAVRVITPAGAAERAFAAIDGVETVPVPELRRGSRTLKLVMRTLRFLFHGAREAIMHRPAWVYTYDRTSICEVGAVTALIFRIPLLFHINNTGLFASRRLRFRLASRATIIWSVSSFIRDEAIAAGVRGNHRILLNCLPEQPRAVARVEARARLGIPQDRKAAILLGRISPFKGQATFIRALADERLRERDVHGYIVGGDTGEGIYDKPPRPDYRAYLESLIAELGVGDRIHLIGSHPANLAYPAADVACILSDSEAFGLVVGEAVTFGVPIVATNAGGIPEQLGGACPAAELVPPRDAAAAAAAITRLVDDPERAARLAATAAAQLLPRLTFERFAGEVTADIAG